MNYTSYQLFQSLKSIRLATAIVSLLFSLWAYHSAVIINADGILYIYTIDAFKADGLAATQSVYNWPFFPIIAAWLSDLTGWGTEFSVKTLNSILFVLLTDALILLSHKAMPNIRLVSIAAILIVCFYTLNQYRDFIIRDIGYWAFACYALYQFVSYLEQQKLSQAILWQLLMITALLFRIEAAILLVMVPLYVLVTKSIQHKWRAMLQLYSVGILATVVVTVLVIFIVPDIASAFSKVQQLIAYLNPANIIAGMQNATKLLQQEILHPASDHHAARILIFGLVLTVLWELFVGISPAYLVLLTMALVAMKKFKTGLHQKFFIYIVLINIFLLSVFAVKTNLITTRYCILTLTFLLLIILPTLTTYISEKVYLRQKKVLGLIGFLLFASVADNMITTKAKPHLKTVPAWAAKNLPEEARIITTHFRIEYYFNKYRSEGSKIELERKSWNLSKYDYLITYLKTNDEHKQTELEQMGLELIKESGNEDNRVSIYAILQ